MRDRSDCVDSRAGRSSGGAPRRGFIHGSRRGLVASTLVFAVASSSPAADLFVADCRVIADRRAELSFGERGIVAELTVTEGDTVAQGEPLVRLFDADVRAALAAAKREAANEVALLVAKKTAEVAKVEYEQVLEGNRRTPGTFSKLDVRRLKLTAEQTRLEIEQAEHELAVAADRVEELQGRLERSRIVAPFDGFVTRVLIERGEGVVEGNPVVEIVDPDVVRVEGFVDGLSRAALRIGRKVLVRPSSYSSDPYAEGLAGTIAFVDRVVQPVTGQIRFWARVESPGPGLLPGMTATVTSEPTAGQAAEIERSFD